MMCIENMAYARKEIGGGSNGILSSSNMSAMKAFLASSDNSGPASAPGRSMDHGSSYDQPAVAGGAGAPAPKADPAAGEPNAEPLD